jgi:hypothetical protein
MRLFVFIITIIISLGDSHAQKPTDSVKSYMVNSVKEIKQFSEKDLFFTFHGTIKYKSEKFQVYDFGFNPVLHEPYLYILFYNCNTCENLILGKKELLNDILDLNNMYINSTNFSKKLYSELFKILKNDYLPGKKGEIITREEFNKMKK